MDDLLATGNILGIAAMAGGALALLKKHWYRSAQTLFGVATLLADIKVFRWAMTSDVDVKTRVGFGLAGLLGFTLVGCWAIWKVQEEIREFKAKIHDDTKKRDFLVERLTDFTREAARSWESSPGKFRDFYMQSGSLEAGLWRKIEKFLEIHLPNEVERFKGKGIDAIDEIIKELLDGQPMEHKLTFEVDTEPFRSEVSLGYGDEDEALGLLEATVKMKFLNTDINDGLVIKLLISIFRKSSSKETALTESVSKLTWRTGIGESQYFHARTVPASSASEDLWFFFKAYVRQDAVGELDRDCVLRLTMVAARQGPCSQDFPVSWERAKEGKGYLMSPQMRF